MKYQVKNKNNYTNIILLCDA